MSEAAELSNALSAMLGNGLAASMGVPDWHYRDLPRMLPKLMAEFRDIVGEDNLKWVTFADYGSTQRGQVLISPAGMDRLREYRSTPPITGEQE